ncbi:MAG: DUF4129 domain-containing protein [Anaerolineales bacterium]|nr:DUF4129 domain-containing protein [Anaerolineales bacterium]
MGRTRTVATAVWAYMRLEVPYIAQALSEMALFVPLTLVFMPWARYWSPWVYFGLLLCLMLIPFNLMRVLSLAGTAVEGQRIILGMGLVLALFAALRTLLYGQYSLFNLTWLIELGSHIRTSGYPLWTQDVTVLLVVLYCWWRGVRLAARSSNMYVIGLQLRVRALLVAPAVAFLAYLRLDWDVTPFLALFCLASLLVVALARAEEVEQEGRGASFELTPGWLGLIFGVATAVVFTGVLLASLTSREQVLGAPQLALQFLAYSVVLTLVTLVGPLVFALLEQVVFYLAIVLAPVAQMLADFDLAIQPPEQVETTGEQAIENSPDLSFVPVLIFALFFIFIAFIIIYSLRRAVRQTNVAGRRTRPVTFTLDEELGDANSMWDRLRGVVPALRAWRMAASIRRIYQQMVAIAAEDGYPRGEAETPFEYQAQLDALWPQATAETSLITQAYVRVRYGELPETRSELEAIFAAWQQLVEMAQEQRERA